MKLINRTVKRERAPCDSTAVRTRRRSKGETRRRQQRSAETRLSLANPTFVTASRRASEWSRKAITPPRSIRAAKRLISSDFPDREPAGSAGARLICREAVRGENGAAASKAVAKTRRADVTPTTRLSSLLRLTRSRAFPVLFSRHCPRITSPRRAHYARCRFRATERRNVRNEA